MILGRLPSTSAYRAAQRKDPEFARLYLEQDEQLRKPWRPPAEEFGLTELLLAGLLGRVGQTNALLADLPVAPGVKRRTKAPPAFPHPHDAIEDLRNQTAAQHHSAIEDAVEAAQARWLAARQQEGGA